MSKARLVPDMPDVHRSTKAKNYGFVYRFLSGFKDALRQNICRLLASV